MIDPTPNEIAALEHAGAMGGEYLENIGCTDLAKLSPQEYATLIETIVTAYGDKLRDLHAQDAVVLARMPADEVPA